MHSSRGLSASEATQGKIHVARDLPGNAGLVPHRDGRKTGAMIMCEEIDIHLGRRLRRRRRLLGLTQQELAEACGVRFQQIQKYECAANRMSAARLYQLSQVLEVPISYFYEGLNETREGSAGGEGGEMFAQKETRDLIQAYYQLDEHPRRRLLDLAKSLHGDAES